MKPVYKPGDRVVAMSHSEGNKIFLYGKGVYEGDFAYEDVTSTEPVVAGTERFRDHFQRLMAGEIQAWLNPRIRLDSGQIVWGCECWWQSEAMFDRMVEKTNPEIVAVDIDEVKAGFEDGKPHGVPDLVRGKTDG